MLGKKSPDKIKMEEIKKGIFRYEKTLDSVEKPLILVHPWYSDRNNKFKVSYGEVGEGYLKNLEKLLKMSKNRNIFLFEESSHFEDSYKGAIENISKISDLRKNSDGIYFLRTNYNNPIPSVASWRDVALVLKNISDKFDIAGGYYWNNPHVFSRGCMGYAKYELRENGIKSDAVPGCCFG